MRVIIVIAILAALAFFGFRAMTGSDAGVGDVVEAATEAAGDAADTATDAAAATAEAAGDAVEATTEAATDAAAAVTETATDAAAEATDAAPLTTDSVIEMFKAAGVDEATMATAQPLIDAAGDNPEMLKAVVEQFKSVLGM